MKKPSILLRKLFPYGRGSASEPRASARGCGIAWNLAVKALALAALFLAAAGYVFLQTTSPDPAPAALMPSGALLYLAAPDFGRLLRDWDSSKVKADWLASNNYAVFSRSNLFSKLEDVYGQYGDATGFVPDLKSLTELAGSESALALYEVREVEFLYITRIPDTALMKSQLWAVRNKFEQRQAGGVSFFQRTDPASKRTVAFALAKGRLFLATRPDLLAQSLELLAGGSKPPLAADRWYRDAAAAQSPGDLRVVMNLESLVKSVYFRSYWVQRNASVLRRYWAGVADVKRSAGAITEHRVLLHAATQAPPSSASVGNLLSLVPPEAGLYKTWTFGDSAEAAALLVQKLIGPQPQNLRDWRDAPGAASPDVSAGSEGDLETRIDEQTLPPDAGISDSISTLRAMIDAAAAHSLLLLQSSGPAVGTFVPFSAVVVLEGDADWNPSSVRASLSQAAGKLWTTSQLGAGWTAETAGRHSIERMDGLGSLVFAARGRLLFLANDATLLTGALDRVGAAQPAGPYTYAAGFRHSRERANFSRLMSALDFATSRADSEFMPQSQGLAPAFFTGNIGSLSRVLSGVTEVRMTEEEKGTTTVQTVVYQLAR